jgi:chemotaxis protein methyltransferase CheR
MPFSSKMPVMSPKEFKLLRNIIHEKTGIYYEPGKMDILTDKIMPLVINHEMDAFIDYYYLLKHDSYFTDEWDHVFDAISVQETYFGREYDQIETLVKVIVPKLAIEAMHHPIRIWSAACASGEEPLTIAISLEESGWFERIPIEIFASDLSPKAISTAQTGVYGSRSFRRWSQALIDKYFIKKDQTYQVNPSIHEHIQWQNANIHNKNDVFQMAGTHIIFCRNVFIYFSEYAIKKTARLLYDCLTGPGYLFTGVSESLLKFTEDFDMQEIDNSFVYVKQK